MSGKMVKEIEQRVVHVGIHPLFFLNTIAKVSEILMRDRYTISTKGSILIIISFKLDILKGET